MAGEEMLEAYPASLQPQAVITALDTNEQGALTRAQLQAGVSLYNLPAVTSREWHQLQLLSQDCVTLHDCQLYVESKLSEMPSRHHVSLLFSMLSPDDRYLTPKRLKSIAAGAGITDLSLQEANSMIQLFSDPPHQRFKCEDFEQVLSYEG